LNAGYEVIAFDRFFFGRDRFSKAGLVDGLTLVQGDTRQVSESLFDGVDAVIDLAGLSNDATSEINPELTRDIGITGGTRIARMAKSQGVKRLLYSSSASVYGAGLSTDLTEESAINPLTEYARCKVAVEQELLPMVDDDFEVVILRNATIYGLAPRMRFDLVINVMTMRAWKDRVIYVMGGGEQWRPVIHVDDVVSAFLTALGAPKTDVSGQVFNVGSNHQNVQVRQIARLVTDAIPNVQIHDIPDDPDQRSYHLNFDKINRVLGFEVKNEISDGIDGIRQALDRRIIDPDDPTTYTLQWYQSLMRWDSLVDDLRIDGKIL
jgi:nucleoside-diphosphate-sugar epimerase